MIQAEQQWATVKEWSGAFSNDLHREPFERPSGVWRLSYKTEVGEPGRNGVVDIVVMTKEGRMAGAAYNIQGEASGVLGIREDRPEYVLEVKSFGPRWRVAVERQE